MTPNLHLPPDTRVTVALTSLDQHPDKSRAMMRGRCFGRIVRCNRRSVWVRLSSGEVVKRRWGQVEVEG